MKMKILGIFFDQYFSNIFPTEKSMKNVNFDFFLRPTFFSKIFPMEKSMKIKILETFFSTNIFFEKFSYGKVNEK